MTDDELAEFLGLRGASDLGLRGLSDAEIKRVLAHISPERRATYERMARVADDLSRGVVPPGVITCR